MPSRWKFLEKMLMENPSVSGRKIIRNIRRKGLAFGLDLTDPLKHAAFLKACIRQGVIVDYYLFREASFRLAPPLTISYAEIEEACGKLACAISEIA